MTSYSTEPYGFGTADPAEYDSPSPYDQTQHEDNPWPAEPLPVVSVEQREAPQYGSCMTWTIPAAGVGQPVQILQRRTKRYKAKVSIVSLPAILTTITAPAVPATGVAQQNLNASPVQVVISPNGATITAVTINGVVAGTAAGTYIVPGFGSIAISYTVAIPTWTWQVIGTGTVIVNSKLDPLQGANPQGATYAAAGTQCLEWDTQQPLYAIGIGGGAVVTSVDEAFGER